MHTTLAILSRIIETTLTFTLPDEPFRILEKASIKLNLVPEDVARILLERYLISSKDVFFEINEDAIKNDTDLSVFFDMSQSLLAKDWDTPEEDEIWAHL